MLTGNGPVYAKTDPAIWWERKGPLGNTHQIIGSVDGIGYPINACINSPGYRFIGSRGYFQATVVYKAAFGIPTKVGLVVSIEVLQPKGK